MIPVLFPGEPTPWEHPHPDSGRVPCLINPTPFQLSRIVLASATSRLLPARPRFQSSSTAFQLSWNGPAPDAAGAVPTPASFQSTDTAFQLSWISEAPTPAAFQSSNTSFQRTRIREAPEPVSPSPKAGRAFLSDTRVPPNRHVHLPAPIKPRPAPAAKPPDSPCRAR